MGSTISYLQRYTLLALTGLAAHEQDDDGKGSDPPEYINTDQCTAINALIKETGTDKKLFLKWAEAESVEKIVATKNESALAELTRKKDKMREPGE
jgi:hypothetical protein